MQEITWKDFEQVEMRTGTIIEAKEFEKARKPAYKLLIDFGKEIGKLKSSAQITRRYTLEELPGRQVIAVINFPKKQIADFMSECLILGAVGEDGDVVLLATDQRVENGRRIG